MSAKEEAGEIHSLVACNGSVSRISETGLHLYPVSEYESGEGLPYAPVDWPNAGDKWGWRAGKRATSSGTFKDRYLYLPKRLQVRKDGKMNAFRSRISVKHYLQSEYPSMDINQFFASFSWMIPSKDIDFDSDMKEKTTSSGMKMESLPSDSPFGAITCKAGNRVCSSLTAENPFSETVFCDVCCSEPGFCRDCCCILCCKPISSDYDGYSNIRCEATVVDGYICGHVSHLECALRAYMAGTVGGSISLDAEYLCRYCDSRTDLVSHALKLLNICTSVVSRADIEKILNVGICILRGSQKRSGKELLHRIEAIKAKLMKGVCIEDVFKKESCVDSTSSFKIKMTHHLVDEVAADEDFDRTRFTSLWGESIYYQDLARKKLFLERGISLEKVPESLPGFYVRLGTSGWICFAPEPCKANEQWVREFYANLMVTDMTTKVMIIRGKAVNYGPEAINEVYGLPNHDIELFKAKDCASGSWLVSKLCPGKNVPWAISKTGITRTEFTTEARKWMSIVCSRVSPSGNTRNILVLRAQIVACLLDDIPLNVGHLIVNELRDFKLQDSLSLVFPSLITELCKRAGVEERPEDTWVGPRDPIFPLKARGEGTAIKSKRRKIDSGKSVSIDECSTKPSSVGPFESLANEMNIIIELLKQLPQGPGESSVPVSYVPQHDFDAYLEDQRKQKAQLSGLEKAYADLAKSHGELSRSHEKKRKREKRRDKFFTRMRKGMKGIWKTLKENEPLPSSRPDDPTDIPAEWSEDEDADADDSEAIESEEE